MRRQLVAFAVLGFLAGCKGDGNGGDGPVVPDVPAGEAACAYLAGTGVTTEFTSACSQCTISDEALAVDGVLETFARIQVPAVSSGRWALRGLAASGTSYPAMSRAGAVISREGSTDGNSFGNNGYELMTYYSGAPTGTEPEVSPNVGSGSGRQSAQVFEFTSQGIYDAVEVAVSEGGNTTAYEIRVHEFCAGD